MAEQQFGPLKGRVFAAGAAVVTMLACLTVPAFAATPHRVLCSEADNPTLDVPVEALTANTVNHDLSIAELGEIKPLTREDLLSHVQILQPLAEAAIRDAFEEDEADKLSEDAKSSDATAPRFINAKLPGVSDERLIRNKKRMYRRDI